MIVTRFAPSPTGNLHFGGARTALFGWLAARQQGGRFILRIDDTDQSRLVESAVDQIVSDLKWLGIDWDFGPDKPSPDFGSCIQSQRLDIYQKIVRDLIESGSAYYDKTSPDKLASLRQEAADAKRPFIYRKSMAEVVDRPEKGTVIRIAFKDGQTISWDDVVKGRQSWQTDQIGDFVAIKSDGYPTYHFATVVDDFLMNISHVIRGDEWLSSTPKHLHLFDCLKQDRPKFVHVPAILSETGNKKLSKRDQAVDVDHFRQSGYLAAGLINFMSLIGWSPTDEREFFDIEGLLENFSLDRIQSSPGRFNQRRLDYLNGKHIRSLSAEARFETAGNWWPKSSEKFDFDYKGRALDLVYERLKKWDELADLTDYFFVDPKPITVDVLAKVSKLEVDQIQTIQPLIVDSLQNYQGIDFEALEDQWRELADKYCIKTGKLFMMIRYQLTGSKTTPGLFDIIGLLGRDASLHRLKTLSSNG